MKEGSPRSPRPRFSPLIAGALVLVLLGGWGVAGWAADRRPVKVRQVIDGDTLILADETRLRLIGLDAPELGREGRPDKPWARTARQRLASLVGGRVVELHGAQRRHLSPCGDVLRVAAAQVNHTAVWIDREHRVIEGSDMLSVHLGR